MPVRYSATPASPARPRTTRRLLAARVTEAREDVRVAFAGNDGAYDAQPGLADEVGHGAVDEDVHLIERLLHPLDGTDACFDEVVLLTS